MIREAEWSTIVVDLANIITFAENSIAPRRDTSFLRRIIGIRANVVFVCGKERDARLGVVGECKASNHLKIQLSRHQLLA